MQSFGKKLKELREGRGWTQEELAQKTGISRTSLARMETDAQVPSWPSVFALASALGVASDTFPDVAKSLRGTEKRPPPKKPKKA
jgi:transcriptional regulator with XRE-family HTH domain